MLSSRIVYFLIKINFVGRMKISFSKYQGTGNDFVMLNNIDGFYDDLTLEQIKFLCHRRMGVGADGLIKISPHVDYDFEVEYYNADGSQSFCGNGARCSVAFAKYLKLIEETACFKAIDGPHTARITDDIVHLDMLPVTFLGRMDMDYVIDTGSPHYVRFVDDKNELDIVDFGQSIRYSPKFKTDGINVNTVLEFDDSSIEVATYERGVEDETLSCGTGVTACVLAFMDKYKFCDRTVSVSTKGGQLSVYARRDAESFSEIILAGPAKKVFDGSVEL